jgi:predicted phage terminase large subunit-like protein
MDVFGERRVAGQSVGDERTIGIDEHDDVWVLPDLIWDRMETPQMVEEMLALMARHKPLVWWPESENIIKSIGPVLRKRQVESNIYTLVDPLPALHDKRAQARSIQGRLSQKKVRFPKFAPWWRDAKAQLLKFPFGAHDDFVTFVSLIGLGLDKEFPAEHIRQLNEPKLVTGSYAWIKAQSAKRDAREKRRKAVAGW